MYDCVMAACQDGAVIDHFGINCADWEKSKAFYDKVLGVLGYTRQMDVDVAIGYGTDGKPDFWIADMNAGDGGGAEPRGARRLPGRGHRRRAGLLRRRASKLGAESLHEPRLWPEYHPGYFGAFVRDPDGNNIEAVFHGAPPEKLRSG